MAAPKGHPKYIKRVDEKQLAKLAGAHLTTKEISAILDISVSALEKSPYKEIISVERGLTKQRLKQKALQRALIDSSDVMLKFCLKNYCGMTDNDIIPIDGNGEDSNVGYTIKIVRPQAFKSKAEIAAEQEDDNNKE